MVILMQMQHGLLADTAVHPVVVLPAPPPPSILLMMSLNPVLVSLVVSPGKGSHDAVPNGPPKVDVPVAAHVDAKTSQG